MSCRSNAGARRSRARQMRARARRWLGTQAHAPKFQVLRLQPRDLPPQVFHVVHRLLAFPCLCNQCEEARFCGVPRPGTPGQHALGPNPPVAGRFDRISACKRRGPRSKPRLRPPPRFACLPGHRLEARAIAQSPLPAPRAVRSRPGTDLRRKGGAQARQSNNVGAAASAPARKALLWQPHLSPWIARAWDPGPVPCDTRSLTPSPRRRVQRQHPSLSHTHAHTCPDAHPSSGNNSRESLMVTPRSRQSLSSTAWSASTGTSLCSCSREGSTPSRLEQASRHSRTPFTSSVKAGEITFQRRCTAPGRCWLGAAPCPPPSWSGGRFRACSFRAGAGALPNSLPCRDLGVEAKEEGHVSESSSESESSMCPGRDLALDATARGPRPLTARHNVCFVKQQGYRRPTPRFLPFSKQRWRALGPGGGSAAKSIKSQEKLQPLGTTRHP